MDLVHQVRKLLQPVLGFVLHPSEHGGEEDALGRDVELVIGQELDQVVLGERPDELLGVRLVASTRQRLEVLQDVRLQRTLYG